MLVELTCETPAHVQTPLEPHAAVALVGRRPADGLGLDAGHVRRARGSSRRASGFRRESVRVISEFIGGGFGAQAGRGRRGAPRGRARARRRAGRCGSRSSRHEDQLVGGRRSRTRQTVTPRREPRRDAAGDRARGGRRDGRRRLGRSPSQSPRCSLYACENVRDDGLPRPDEPARAERVPRAGRRRGRRPSSTRRWTSSPRALELDPLELRRRNHVDADQGSRRCPTRASGCSRATTAPPSSPAGPSASALREPARRRAPARHGLRDADLVGRRRAARARVDPPRRRRARARDDRHPGHRHRDADGGADRRGRGARAAARPRRVARRRHRAERLRPGRGRLDDDARRCCPRCGAPPAKVRRQLLSLAADVFEIAVGRPGGRRTGASARRTARSTPTSSR